MSHLDEGVESLAIHLQELRLNVQHVNLRPGDHYSDEDTICSAQPLTRESDRWYRWLDFVPACSYDIQYDNINITVYSSYFITSMKYLPSLICIISQQRTLACSLDISLESKNKST